MLRYYISVRECVKILAPAAGTLPGARRGLAKRAARAALRQAGLALKRGTGNEFEWAGLLRVGGSVELAAGNPAAAAQHRVPLLLLLDGWGRVAAGCGWWRFAARHI